MCSYRLKGKAVYVAGSSDGAACNAGEAVQCDSAEGDGSRAAVAEGGSGKVTRNLPPSPTPPPFPSDWYLLILVGSTMLVSGQLQCLGTQSFGVTLRAQTSTVSHGKGVLAVCSHEWHHSTQQPSDAVSLRSAPHCCPARVAKQLLVEVHHTVVSTILSTTALNHTTVLKVCFAVVLVDVSM